jgi:hypothetical protein
MALHKRVGIIGLGISGKWLISWAFDFLLYPVVIANSGFLIGTCIMTILSFFVCYGLILFYDKTKKDWVGIETLKELEEFKPLPPSDVPLKNFFINGINIVGNFTAWIMKKSDALFFIFLSIKFDPFITVIHIRHGAHQYNGLSRRDWGVFLTSLLIANLYWAIAVYMGISIAEAVVSFVSGLM